MPTLEERLNNLAADVLLFEQRMSSVEFQIQEELRALQTKIYQLQVEIQEHDEGSERG